MELLEMELEAILEASKDNIVITDGYGIVLRASSSCLDIYGVTANSLIGQSVYELEKQDIFSPSITIKVIQDKKESQVMQKTKNGRVVMATGFPVYNTQGEMIRVISISHDLTEIQSLKEDYEELQIRMQRYETEIEELRGKDVLEDDIIVKSKTMLRIHDLLKRVAHSEASVIFYGESGVGKSILARRLHQYSERNQGPLIEINCSAIPESLFESEMFGYEGGSFTGAHKKGKPGLIELANHGTLFLDEIGDLPFSMQAKLLQVIQEKKLTRIGGVKAQEVNFSLIAATNQDLSKLVREGKFRQDLFYRIQVIPIEIPSLRERKEDIFLLCNHYIQLFNEKYGKSKVLHPRVIHELHQYDWPGNVRELENMIERLVITVEERVIQVEHLPFHMDMEKEKELEEKVWSKEEEQHLTLKEALIDVEKQWLVRAYRRCRTTYEMAEYLGISQPSVVRKLKQYRIDS